MSVLCETIQEDLSALKYSSIYFYDLKIISLEPVLNADCCSIYFILVLTSIKEEIAKQKVEKQNIIKLYTEKYFLYMVILKLWELI